MKQEVKTQWIDALRSGKYKQGQAYMRSEDNEYCCLGVLSELAVEAGVIPAPELGPAGTADRETCYHYGANKEPYYLPREVEEWAELVEQGSDPEIYGLDGTAEDYGTTLSDMNDRGDTFEEIAQVIEDHL